MREARGFNSGRYFGLNVEVNFARLKIALSKTPKILQEELLDGLDHIRRGFFKSLYHNTQLKNKRLIAVKNRGIGKHLRVYRNPHKGNVLDMVLGIFSRSKIVGALEKGATIRPRHGRMLAIPIDRSLTRSGRLKKSVSKYRGDYSQMRGLFVVARGGKVLLAKKSKDGGIKPYFILKSSVRIQPRLKFYDTWARMEGYRAKVLNNSVDKALRRV